MTIESRGGVVLRTYTGRSGAPGPVSLRWDGRYSKNVRAYSAHVVRVTTTSQFGIAALTAPFTVRRTG